MHSFFSKALAFVLGGVWLISKTSIAQIPVALPTEYFADRDISFPVTVGDVTGQDIKAFLLTIRYDPAVLQINGVENAGTLAEDFSLVFNVDVPGEVSVGGAHFEALRGEGALIQLNGKFLKKGTTELAFSSVSFNEGNPQAAPENGEISNAVRVSNEEEGGIPEVFVLAGNYPNPFNPSTAIRFDLPERAEVSVQIVDMLGREVMAIPSQVFLAGTGHRIDVDASSLASGVYVYRVLARGVTKSHAATSTMTLIK